jgi:hypothetical protein
MDDNHEQGADNKGFSNSLSKSSLPPALHGVGVGAKCAHGGGGGTHPTPPRASTLYEIFFDEAIGVVSQLDEMTLKPSSDSFWRERGAI